MYKYYKELDNPNEFYIYLKTFEIDKKNIYHIQNFNISNLSLSKEIFDGINFIEKLSSGIKESLVGNISYEKMDIFYSFISHRDEDCCYNDLKNKIDIDIQDLYSLLYCSIDLANYLIDVVPTFEEKLINIITDLKKSLNNIKEKTSIQLPDKKEYKYDFPNAWFITKNGYLYNTGTGHKDGNLVYPFYYTIEPLLKNNKNILNYNYLEEINLILKRGYVTQFEFQNYANYYPQLPTIMTSEVELEREKQRKLVGISYDDYKKIPKDKLPTPERSYQKNIITLIIGYLAAKQDLFNSFVKLNESNNKKNNMEKIMNLTNNYLPDILVRYSGFNKIESQLEKTICTSNLYSIDMFKEYLDNGWTLHIIPGIIYDSYLDSVDVVNFNSYYVEKYLDENINEYKGKILVKK